MAAKKSSKAARRTARIARVLFIAVALGAVAGTAALGWRWYRTIPLRTVDVVGHRYAPADTLARLSGVAGADTALYDVDPLVVEDRVRRYPWVQSVEALRLPTGTLRLRVEERTPVALVVDRRGRAAFLVDAEGAMLPRPPGAAFNVPLLHGLRADYHPVRRLDDPDVLTLLADLAALDAPVRALVSDVELRGGEAWLYTTPLPGRGSVEVRLGRGGYARKLATLHAFWHRALLPRPDVAFDLVDLRFDSQIVTRERAPSVP